MKILQYNALNFTIKKTFFFSKLKYQTFTEKAKNASEGIE